MNKLVLSIIFIFSSARVYGAEDYRKTVATYIATADTLEKQFAKSGKFTASPENCKAVSYLLAVHVGQASCVAKEKNLANIQRVLEMLEQCTTEGNKSPREGLKVPRGSFSFTPEKK